MSRTNNAKSFWSWAAIVLITCAPAAQTLAEEKQAHILIPRHSAWKYSADSEEPSREWNQTGFDDSEWNVGEAGFGYGDDDDRTVLRRMRGRFRSVYIRHAFEVKDPQQITSLYLYLNYDDGFIAWLNGKQVAAACASRRDGVLRVELHEAGEFERFELRDVRNVLRKGRNVLAIEGHNAALNSSDFSLDPLLTTTPLKRPVSIFEPADFLVDLDELQQRLEDQSSYLTRRKFDYTNAIDELRHSITPQTTLTDFIVGLRKLVMRLGDCHASVRGNTDFAIRGVLPFRPADTGDGLAALRLNQDELLDPECPYVEALDGIPLQRWIDVAGKFAPDGSQQLKHRWSLDYLVLFDMLREEFGLPHEATVNVSLRSADGSQQRRQTLRLTRQRFSVASVKLHGTRLLDDNIGYLRIPEMDSRLVESLVKRIVEFRNTDGLIIDVRDNGGGTYHILRAIYPFFCSPDAGPYVTNIAAYRLSPRFKYDHIAYRPTHRLSWEGWSDEERAAIHIARSKFRPEWSPDREKFSDWHFMLLNRSRSSQKGDGKPDGYFHYDRPVVVLSNAGSFSATDGFLSAFADLPQVTIVGEPSAGGSGARRRFELPRTHVTVSVSSMISYRPNGKPFDGNGVEVDVEARPAVEDYTRQTDSVLARAVRVIKDQE